MSTNVFGNAPNQVPTNADLGGMAYQDPRYVVVVGGNVNPTNFGTSNAQILFGNITGIQNLAATAGNITTLVANNFSAANINMTGTTVTSGTVNITNATDSSSPTTGALRITGGAGILGNLHIGGNLFVVGNTFTLSTTDVSIQDSIIELHTFANLDPLGANDGRDIGIKMHYYDTADSHAFLGRANDTGYLEWYAKGTETTGNIFVGTYYGTIKAGAIELANTTAATSTTSGALKVGGGVGIADGLYVNGTTYLQNASTPNIHISGGSITGVTAAATRLVATDFSSGNIYQSAADTFVASNFSAANIYQIDTGQSIQSANVQIGTNWGTTSRANLSVANISAALNATNGNITTLVSTNFSAGNIYQVGSGQSIQTANAQIGTDWGTVSRANLFVANVSGMFNSTNGNVTTLVATNFSAGNIYQTGTGQSIQTANAQIGTDWGVISRANLFVANISGFGPGQGLNATLGNISTLGVTNFTANTVLITKTNDTANLVVNGNITVNNMPGNLIINGNVYCNNGAQDLSANALVTSAYVNLIGIIWGV
jgi:hypothetical protein